MVLGQTTFREGAIMKKIVAVSALALSLTGLVSVAACGGRTPAHPSAASTSAASTSAALTSAASTPPLSSISSLSSEPSTELSTETGSDSLTGSTTAMSEPANPVGGTEVYLANLPIAEGYPVNAGAIDINGHEYAHSIWQSYSPTQYDLKRRCDQLTYTAGITDNSSSDGVIQFEVYGDNRRLKSFRLGFGHDSQQTVSVRNVLRLKLQITDISASGNLSAGWGDAAVRCSSRVSS
jgi:hypothetical protein